MNKTCAYVRARMICDLIKTFRIFAKI